MTNPIILLMEINIMFLEYIIFETRLADAPELGSLIGEWGRKEGRAPIDSSIGLGTRYNSRPGSRVATDGPGRSGSRQLDWRG